ncbi:MAG: nicotinamide riboside transporter PnuC [Candidatus Gastranaerophilales bacterium]|nr:nicotinamide riboside transporter PnuC [Candidatus Gastranaerophilales bacterium]
MEFLKSQLTGFGRFETKFFICAVFFVIFLSFITNDSKIALVSAICGIGYTIFAGKGKIICYFIGITGSICYCYLAFKNAFFGNLLLWGLYYLPMEIIGIFQWKKYINKEKSEIYKTKLSKNERIVYFSLTLICSFILCGILFLTGGKTPLFDGITTSFSVLGQLLTVKRCIEQWYVWFFVNLFSLIMWITAYLNGSDCLATVYMWGIYLILSVYFLKLWKKEINAVS